MPSARNIIPKTIASVAIPKPLGPTSLSTMPKQTSNFKVPTKTNPAGSVIFLKVKMASRCRSLPIYPRIAPTVMWINITINLTKMASPIATTVMNLKIGKPQNLTITPLHSSWKASMPMCCATNAINQHRQITSFIFIIKLA